MRKISKALGIIMLLLLSNTMINAQVEGKSKMKKPSNYTHHVKIIVNEKSRSYYSLDSEKESIIRLNGPGKLKLYTRAKFVDSNDTKAIYEITYSLNGGEDKTLKVRSNSPSKSAKYSDVSSGTPGASRKFEIDIPRGNNQISFKLLKNNKPVDVRYVFTPITVKVDWIEYAPRQFEAVCDIITNETVTSYYKYTKEKPLKIEVIGPTQIRVFTRIGFNYQMRGSVNYRLQVKKDGKLINTYQLNNKRSEVSIFKKTKDLTPGKANEFVIDVPKGKHTYEIIPTDDNKPDVFSRLMIIRDDVSNSE